MVSNEPPLGRMNVAPLGVEEVEHVEMGDWVSGWLAVGWAGEPLAGYAQLSQGLLGEVVASFTLMLPEGVGSCTDSPATERFLRYDPARNSVDYIAHVAEFSPGWSLEGAARVSEHFADELSDSWPVVVFQHLVDSYPLLDVYPLSLEQAQDMGWSPYFEDEHPPPFEHLWRPVDLSE